MSHKNQSPIEANGTHKKSEITICSILESPLHCWPLTMFLSKEIDHKQTNGKKIVEKKMTKITIALILFILFVGIHSETFGHPAHVPGSPGWGQVSPQGRLPIWWTPPASPEVSTDHPGIPWVSVPRNKKTEERLRKIKEENRQRKKRLEEQQKRLDEWTERNLK